MKKIGFFGGTFDPIHLGHINLALQLLEIHQLDEVIFCPAFQSPLKSHPMAHYEHRMAMTKLAIRDISSFRFSSCELKRGGVSYTIDTLRALHKQFDRKKEKFQLYLLLSEESLESFHRWKQPQEIVRLARPIIGSRGDVRKVTPMSPFKKILLQGLTFTHLFDISSTQIRQRIKKGLYCGHLLDAKVLRYIQKHQLYHSSTGDNVK